MCRCVILQDWIQVMKCMARGCSNKGRIDEQVSEYMRMRMAEPVGSTTKPNLSAFVSNGEVSVIQEIMRASSAIVLGVFIYG